MAFHKPLPYLYFPFLHHEERSYLKWHFKMSCRLAAIKFSKTVVKCIKNTTQSNAHKNTE